MAEHRLCVEWARRAKFRWQRWRPLCLTYPYLLTRCELLLEQMGRVEKLYNFTDEEHRYIFQEEYEDDKQDS